MNPYTKTNWATNDLISAEKLNKIEDGIEAVVGELRSPAPVVIDEDHIVTGLNRAIISSAPDEITITIPAAVSGDNLSVNVEILIVTAGEGVVNIGCEEGVTLNGLDYTEVQTLENQYDSVFIKQILENEWIMYGRSGRSGGSVEVTKELSEDYTLLPEDVKLVVLLNALVPKTVTVPLMDIPLYSEISFIQIGDGELQIVAEEGVVINGEDYTHTFRSMGKYKTAVLKNIDVNEWILVGVRETSSVRTKNIDSSYILDLEDEGSILLVDFLTEGQAITIPSFVNKRFPINSEIAIVNLDGYNGYITPETGVVVNKKSDGTVFLLDYSFKGAVLKNIGVDNWLLIGMYTEVLL